MENNNSSQLNYIAIVGMSGRFPAADTVDAFWQNLVKFEQSSTDLSDDELRASGVSEAMINDENFVKKSYIIEDIDLFDAGFFGFTARDAQITDPQQRLLLECSHEAIEHAGYSNEKYDGLIGVYAGIGSMAYYIRNLLPSAELLSSVGPLRMSIGNEKSFASTMVSYKLNLKGPSVNVDTACSTSLVAVHQACQSLLSYECDMALAGGVSLDVPQKIGMHYTEGSIISPDGRCRPFDADAKGTVKGNGAGIVVLKRLVEAIEDGDTVYAVIKGSATNNDGSVKVGYTASSIEGQSEVIADAISRADIDAGSIRFVEAHGTGTILGDPIEIKALSEVYREHSDENQFCAIGSVKANIGHLDIAAGVAGIIKSALSLYHKQLPPSINYSAPNPKIDFANSPFFVNTDNLPLVDEGHDIHAGVSSFGIGGSNVHVVMGQGPSFDNQQSNREQQLLVVSAKSSNSLSQQLLKLGEHLGADSTINLADAAYTLQMGRNEYAYRAVVAGDDNEKLSQALIAGTSLISKKQCERENGNVYFMFPGQGAQHLGMAADLYRHEAPFKETVDRCAQLFTQHIGTDIREVLFNNADETVLNSTKMSQPALFTIEYAMAKLWQANNVTATAMIGHSIGEYVAACLAGVFSLEDAIKLVSTRATLMNSLPTGSMLMVHLPQEQVSELVNAKCALAAVNGPNISVLSGETEIIEQLQSKFEQQDISCRILQTSHAFHSHMLDPILTDFAQAVRTITLNPPTSPYVSNVSGDWINASQATDPQYWVSHLRGTVQFAKGLQTILADKKAVLLEVGPGQVLTTLAKRSFALDNVVASARHPKNQRNDVEGFLQAVGQLWLEGVVIDWTQLHQQTIRRRIALPTYQFDKQSYWVGQPLNANEPRTQQAQVENDAVVTSDVNLEQMGTEDTIKHIWQNAFGIDKVNVTENFFQLGGDSLLATQLVSQIRQHLNVQVALSELFEAQSLAEFIEMVQGHADNESIDSSNTLKIELLEPDIENRYKPFPLTDIQQAYWVGRSSAVDLGDVSTTIYLEVEIKSGKVEQFQSAWNQLINHHEMLRAIFLDTGEQQILADVPEYIFDTFDLSALDEHQTLEQELSVREQMSHQVLPCGQWPLFDIKALKRSDTAFRLCINIDVLIVDAWSMNMLIEQWLKLYHDSDFKLNDLTFSFRDYVIGEHSLRESPAYYDNEAYWFDRIDSLPGAPALPLVASPSSIKDVKFERFNYDMEAPRWKRLKEKALANGVTPNSLLIGAFCEVLTLWSENPHFALCLTNYNRHPFHEQADDIVGDFTSLTLLEINSQAQSSFIDRVSKTQTQLWSDLDNRLVSAVHVLREMSKRRNERVTLPVVFTSTLGGRALEHEHTENDFAQEGFGLSQSSQVWLDHQVLEWQGKLRFNWDSVASLFPDDMIGIMFETYCNFLEALVDNDDIWQATLPIAIPAVAPAMETAKFDDHLLHAGLKRLAQTHADSFALAAGDEVLTYGQLDNVADHIAAGIHQYGVEKEELVAVIMDKGWQQVAATHGILRSGGAYLPIDSQWPEQRQRDLLETTSARTILTNEQYQADFKAWGFNVIVTEPSWLNSKPATVVDVDVQPQDLAYVIFTSGSTGKPKGVMIDHQGAMNTICDINQRFDVTAKDRIFGLSALSFDLSVYDIFAPYFVGAGLVVPINDSVQDPSLWHDILQQHQVTIWNTVPALFQILTEYEQNVDADCLAIRLALLSGDWIPLNLPQFAREKLDSSIDIIGLGGATECSIWSVFYPIKEVNPQWRSIPYGKGLTNQRLYVLNRELEECRVGVTGDIYIAGIGLALGYYKDEQKTNDHFIVHPQTGERLYRTGDCGKYFVDGAIEFMGRKDNQVKVNGFRIELGEIESAIRDSGYYEEAVVVAKGANQPGVNNNTQLIAYLVNSQSKADKQAQLFEFKLSRPGIRQALSTETQVSLPAANLSEQQYKRRKSYRQYLGENLDVNRLSQLLACVSSHPNTDRALPKYRYASAGSLNAVQTYLYVKTDTVKGLDEGFYYYNPDAHALTRLHQQDGLSKSLWGNGDNPQIFEQAAFSLFLVGEKSAIAPVYGDEAARDMLHLEAGYMSHLLMEESPNHHIGLCAIGYIDKAAEQCLGLTESQTILHSIVGGSISAAQLDCWASEVRDNDEVKASEQNAAPQSASSRGSEDLLIAALAEKLPRYMVPSAYVTVEKLPLTGNGKIDRKALLNLDTPVTVKRNKVEPKTQMERMLLSIWSQALGFDDFGTQDSFFDVGGDSVSILKVHQQLCKQLAIKLTVVDLFKYPKVAELAEFLSTATVTEKPAEDHKSKAQKQKAALGRQRKMAKGRVKS